MKINNQDNYSGSVINPDTGEVTGLIHKIRDYSVSPYYVRMYTKNNEFHKLMYSISAASTYRVLSFVIWSMNNSMISNSDKICLSHKGYLEYCNQFKLTPVGRTMYFKGIKELISFGLLKRDEAVINIYKVNFKIIANGKYKQEEF